MNALPRKWEEAPPRDQVGVFFELVDEVHLEVLVSRRDQELLIIRAGDYVLHDVVDDFSSLLKVEPGAVYAGAYRFFANLISFEPPAMGREHGTTLMELPRSIL